MIKYEKPNNWAMYDWAAIQERLMLAKASIMTLRSLPQQRRWTVALQQVQLKREVGGSSRIEGATFVGKQLDEALKETPEQLVTRSQRQAAAAAKTYRWISTLPGDMPINNDLICSIHRSIVIGADDDHCKPGTIRWNGENVHFGVPAHRGCEGGDDCSEAFAEFTHAIANQYPDHDPVIQALAAHYHFAAMHPFQDGNGRTARALEALMLQRAGLHDSTFIAMSNYYYEEKAGYLESLAEVRRRNHDLTPFLLFALRGVALQCDQLIQQIQHCLSKALYRNVAVELLGRLQSKRKRVLAERHLDLIDKLLDAENETLDIDQLMKLGDYGKLKSAWHALIRDLVHLRFLGAITITKGPDPGNRPVIAARLKWPTEVTETDFFQKVKELPKAKSLSLFD